MSIRLQASELTLNKLNKKEGSIGEMLQEIKGSVSAVLKKGSHKEAADHRDRNSHSCQGRAMMERRELRGRTTTCVANTRASQWH